MAEPRRLHQGSGWPCVFLSGPLPAPLMRGGASRPAGSRESRREQGGVAAWDAPGFLMPLQDGVLEAILQDWDRKPLLEGWSQVALLRWPAACFHT